MSTTRDTILDTLASVGIQNMSVEDIICEFQSSDELSGLLAGATDAESIEQIVLAHLPQYLDLRGMTGALPAAEEVDPTATQQPAAPTAMPSMGTAAQQAAVDATMKSSIPQREMMTENAEMVAVLIDKPYPGEWMNDIGKQHVKGDLDKVIDDMKKHYQPDANIDTLLSATNTYFIPTNEQLAQVMERDKAKKVGSKTKTDPAWYGFDNEAAYNGVLNALTSGDGTLDVLVAPREDEGEGAYKVKGWRWASKGFVVRVPKDTAGAITMDEVNMTRKQLMGFLGSQTMGALPPKRDNGLGAILRTAEKKVKDSASATAVQKVPVLRVLNNNLASAPELRVINSVGDGQGKMTVRSSAFYFVVRITKHGEFRVVKQRLSLAWDQAPVWVRKDEYVQAFPTQKKGGTSPKAMSEAFEAAKLLNMTVMAGDVTERGAYGMADFIRGVEETVNEQATKAAAALSL